MEEDKKYEEILTRKSKRKMLLIVDPQIDFITGSLPVPGAEKAMDALARYVTENGDHYSHLFVTCDQHGLNDRSFKEFGGKWPPHCIESSVGAAIWPPLMEALIPHGHYVLILYKGNSFFNDEFSIFQNENGRQSMGFFLRDDVDEIDICGLAGDVCVAKTLEDALRIYPRIKYRLLKDFTASLDGGTMADKIEAALEERNSWLEGKK